MDKRMLTVILGILALILDAMKDDEYRQPRSEMAWVFLCPKQIKGGIENGSKRRNYVLHKDSTVARTGDKGTGGSDFQRSAFPCWIGLEGDSETGSYRGWTFYFWLLSECER